MAYFISPKVIFGRGALQGLGRELEGKGKRAVVITDPRMEGHSADLANTLRNAGYQVRVWGGVKSDPTVEIAQEAAKVLLDFLPQWIVGFGGGSAIDTAKAAWVLYERPEFSSMELNKSVNPKALLNLRRKARLVCIPTTSGTGADATWVAVLTDPVSHRKLILAHNDLVPDISVLIPELTLGMPKDLTASTGMDALAHAVEGFTSRQRTEFSDGFCLQAMKIIFEWLPRAYHGGENMKAREKMQIAATIAGIGFGNSNTGLSHALAHALGGWLGLSHGRAVGITLPYALDYICKAAVLPKAPEPVDRLAEAARFLGLGMGSKAESANAFIRKIRNFLNELGEPLTLKDAGLSKSKFDEAIEDLVRLAIRDPNMYTIPCECNEADLRALFQQIWHGKD